MSWIHVQDWVGAIHHILKNDLIQGAVNMVAPKPVKNLEFVKTLAGVLSRPAIFPMPEFAVKLAFGEMGEEVLLAGQKVEPTKLVSTGYPYRYCDLRPAMEALLKK
jgi:NAD dependent epimerase/dehydratase family enzyme